MKINEYIPSVEVQQFKDGEIVQINLLTFSRNKTMLLVGIPGAFSPTCSETHVPGFLNNAEKLRRMGIDDIVFLVTNDFFVVRAWEDEFDVQSNVHFFADGSQKFAKAANKLLDLTEVGLGIRGQRYASLIKDGCVQQIYIEPDATLVTVSGAEAMLGRL